MLNDPSFKQYLKEKWDDGHAMVPHPQGGGKLIEMLSAYTGYPAYRDLISEQYQQWLDQKQQLGDPDTLNPVSIFDRMEEIYNQIPPDEAEEMSSLDFHKMLLESDKLSSLEKAYLKIFGSTHANMLALNDGAYLNDELFKVEFKSNQRKLRSWLQRIQNFQTLPKIDQIQYRRLISAMMKLDFKANVDVEKVDPELSAFKFLDDLNKLGLTLDTVRENLAQLDKLNLKGDTKRQVEQLDKLMKGDEHEPFRVLDALFFITNPIYLAKEDEDIIKDQLSLMDPTNDKEEYSFLSNLIAGFHESEILELARKNPGISANNTKKIPILQYHFFDEGDVKLSDIILPNIHAELSLYSNQDKIILNEATLSEGINLSLRGESSLDSTLINSEGTKISRLKSDVIINCDLHFLNPISNITNFFSKNISKSKLSGEFRTDQISIIEDTTINNANCKISCTKHSNNKIINSTVDWHSNDINGIYIKNSKVNLDCSDKVNVNCEGSTIISHKLYFREANFKNTKIKITHVSVYDPTKLTGTISDSILENDSIFNDNENSPDEDYFPMELFKNINEPLHLSNSLFRKYNIDVPSNLDVLEYIKSSGLILYDCKLQYENNIPDKEEIERWNKIKSRLNIEMYDADPFPQLSKGLLSVNDLINHSGDLDDVFEYHMQSPESLINEITDARHKIDKLEKDLKVNKDEKEQIALKNEIQRLEHVVETKEDLLNNPETSEIEFRRYLEDI